VEPTSPKLETCNIADSAATADLTAYGTYHAEKTQRLIVGSRGPSAFREGLEYRRRQFADARICSEIVFVHPTG
jgi:hypothetical protein